MGIMDYAVGLGVLLIISTFAYEAGYKNSEPKKAYVKMVDDERYLVLEDKRGREITMEENGDYEFISFKDNTVRINMGNSLERGKLEKKVLVDGMVKDKIEVE